MTSVAAVLARRRDLTQATLDAWSGRVGEWGKVDCARMGAAHARSFGHKVGLLRFGNYRSEAGARAALARQGCAHIGEAIDRMGLLPIPFARAWVGDVFALRSTNGLGGIGIVLGHDQVLMFRDEIAQPCRPQAALYDNLLGCWRLELKGRAAHGPD